MQNHFGEKIKAVAIVFLILDIIASVVSGILIMALNENLVGGLITIILGILLSLPLYYLLAGFGQLVINSEIIVKNTERAAANNRPSDRRTESSPFKQAPRHPADLISDADSFEISCPACKKHVFFTKQDLVSQTHFVCPYCDNKIPLYLFSNE